MGVGGQRHAPAALPQGKTRQPFHSRLGGPQGRSGRVRKIRPLTGIRSPDRPARSESLYGLSYRGPQETLRIRTEYKSSPETSVLNRYDSNMTDSQSVLKKVTTHPQCSPLQHTKPGDEAQDPPSRLDEQ